MNIAWLGLGNMGMPMAEHLYAEGFPLVVYNRTAEKAHLFAAEKKDVRIATTPAEAALGADVIITMLADDQALESVTNGENGILQTAAKGAIHLSMSTVSVALIERLIAVHQNHELSFVSAPVFGRPDMAAQKKLWVVAAGPKGEVERLQPIFNALAQGSFYGGEKASLANVIKLCGNFMLMAMLEALGEALTLAEKAGLDPDFVLEILNTALFKSPVYANYGNIIVKKRYQPAGFKFQLGLKDASLVDAAALSYQVPMPLAALIRNHYLEGVACGCTDQDWAALAEVLRKKAGF
jgi:3-hydroxyisobutyrate dehydrogenase-like beta-hydroxyacid dehydrogenase